MELSAMLGCPEKAFRMPQGEWEESVTAALRESFALHSEKNAFYRAQCEAAGVGPDDIGTLADLAKMPLLPMGMFKNPDAHVLLTASLADVELEIRSTGDSGVPSVARRDATTTTRMLSAVFAQYREFFGISNGAGLFLSPSAVEAPEMGMVKAAVVLNGLLDHHAYVVRDYTFDPEEALGLLRTWGESMTRHIIGPPFLITRLVQALEEQGSTLRLDPDSMVITLGGWTRYTGQKIVPAEFYEQLDRTLGVPADRVRDMYGMIESNMLAVECEHHRKHVPPWSYVSVRDVTDTSVEVAPGKTGVIATLDALNTAYPGYVLFQDVGEVDVSPCPCGRTGQTVTFRRRLQGAELGCCAVSIEKFIDSREIVAECELPSLAPVEG
ncbi:hypothetical protein ACFYNM_15560 [Streptomyces spororaveus]|uniref:LuxE/PaaK family acyltransferase n=1 Tax=Streptomyces spororaveus TaxID=284039 RepID=UPI0036D12FB5